MYNVGEQGKNKINSFKKICVQLKKEYGSRVENFGDGFSNSLGKYGDVSFLSRINEFFVELDTIINENQTKEKFNDRVNNLLMDLSLFCLMYLVEQTKDMVVNEDDEDQPQAIQPQQQAYNAPDANAAQYVNGVRRVQGEGR